MGNNIMILALCMTFLAGSCSKKEYNLDDFTETQGLIVSAKRTKSPFDSSNMKEIVYEYFVNDSIILTGSEDFQYVDMIKGVPIIVLVHKDNPKKSFYWRNGIYENITVSQRTYLINKVEEMIASEN